MDWLVTIKSYNYYSLFTKRCMNGKSMRKEVLLFLVAKVSERLDLGKRDLIWLGVSEFGISGIGHLHILFSFDNMRDIERKQTKILHCEQYFLNAVIQSFSTDIKFKLPKGSELHLTPVAPRTEDSKRVIAYVMKLEERKKEKEVFMPKWFKARRDEKKWTGRIQMLSRMKICALGGNFQMVLKQFQNSIMELRFELALQMREMDFVLKNLSVWHHSIRSRI